MPADGIDNNAGWLVAPPRLTLRSHDGMVAGMTEMMNETHDWDGCLMCAVRALTEGRPKDWAMTKNLEPGDTVTGVILRQGTQPTHWSDSPVPYVDLWLGGVTRVRVTGHGQVLREALVSAETQVGDTLTVTFEGTRELPPKGGRGPLTYKMFAVSVDRGHH